MAAEGKRERLAAILAADAVGFSRLMDGDEHATAAALDQAREVFRHQIETHHGRLIDMAGDSVLALFDTAAGAASAALAVQAELATAQQAQPEAQQLRFRIGLHLGDVTEKADGSVYGSGINIAARLQTLADPGGITASEAIRGVVKGRVLAGFADLGEQRVKNIAEPVHAYKLLPGDPTAVAHAVVRMDAPVPGFGGRPAVAVLPFANLSGDPEQEYFADGLAADILTRLAMWRWLPVIARNSTLAFKGRAIDVKEVGRALGARYVLEGSVRKAGKHVRVTAQLIDATTGHHLWAERYDRVLEDLFAIQDELTDGIVGALEGAVGRAETERAHLKPPASLDAWDACQRGWWHYYRFTREDCALAVSLFRRALELDPSASLPYSGIAYVRLLEGVLLWADQPREAFVEAMTSARAALAADGLESIAYSAMGYVLAFTAKPDEAFAACRKSIELNPSGAFGYHALGIVHILRGEPEPGVRACEAAIRISPSDMRLPLWLGTLSAGHYLARDYEKAAEIADVGVQHGPHYPMAWRSLANALGQLGRIDDAREALEKFLALMPGYTTEQAARSTLPFLDEAMFQHYLEGLRKAGWKG